MKRTPRDPKRTRRLWRATILGIGLALPAIPSSGGPPPQRLVSVMHENLAAVNGITEAVARDDYARIQREAATLKENADSMRGLDLAKHGLDPARDAVFDDYLTAQAGAAGAIATAALGADGGRVLAGVQQLFDDACVRCHADFREADQDRTPQILFMRNLLSSVQDINRGIAMNDFALVAREAREIGAVAHVFSWSQVVEGLFSIKDPAERTEFRGYFETLSTQAILVEGAAMKRESALISSAAQRMLTKGCLACHAKFRKADEEP